MHIKPLQLLLAVMPLLGIVTATAASKPNILMIVADDMGYGDAGFQGCKDIPTPHLDGLAAAGVRFTNGYVSGPYCSPTRAGLMTGRYQQRYGHEFNVNGGNDGLPLSETTLASRLKTGGYVTGLVGKWHLGGLPTMHPQRRGFDEFFGFIGGQHSYIDPAAILRGNEQVKELDYTTDAFGREAQAFIEHHKSEPWFLYLAFNAVHTPLQATPERLAKFSNISDPRRRTYAAMLLAMDDAIGGVRKKLLETGQEENTLVFFISDNGGPTMKGTTINGSCNLPLRGSKRTTLEGGIRVPFLVSWKGTLTPGVFTQPAIQLDLTATALAAAGLPIQPEWKLDGVDLLPFITGKSSAAPHTALYWRLGRQMAIRMGDFKLVRYDQNADTLTGRDQPATPPRLYNLASDPGETHDLAASQPDQLQALQTKWDAWSATLAKPLWGGGILDDNDGPEPGAPRKQRAATHAP